MLLTVISGFCGCSLLIKQDITTTDWWFVTCQNWTIWWSIFGSDPGWDIKNMLTTPPTGNTMHLCNTKCQYMPIVKQLAYCFDPIPLPFIFSTISYAVMAINGTNRNFFGKHLKLEHLRTCSSSSFSSPSGWKEVSTFFHPLSGQTCSELAVAIIFECKIFWNPISFFLPAPLLIKGHIQHSMTAFLKAPLSLRTLSAQWAYLKVANGPKTISLGGVWK